MTTDKNVDELEKGNLIDQLQKCALLYNLLMKQSENMQYEQMQMCVCISYPLANIFINNTYYLLWNIMQTSCIRRIWNIAYCIINRNINKAPVKQMRMIFH